MRILPGLAATFCAALLGACTVSPPKPVAVPAPPPVAPPSLSATPQTPPQTRVVEPASVWERMRALHVLDDCNYRPQVQHWARRYTTNPARFADNMQRAMPFLLIVVDEIDRLALPGEFAMLPYVESHYRPVPGHGNAPGGMWQFVPMTARGSGLLVTPDYDGRLDAYDSSRAALTLISRYGEEFGDWRLADIAFNTGKYRVKRIIDGADTRTWSAERFGSLPFSSISHEHLDKLLALGCILAQPQRFGVHLPQPSPADTLETLTLTAPIDLRVAARLAGVDIDRMNRFNAAYRTQRMPDDGPWRLHLPARATAKFRLAAAELPQDRWRDWHEQRIEQRCTLADVASENAIPLASLRTVNGLSARDTYAQRGQILLLPGRGPVFDKAATRDIYVVQAGDTLSQIARRVGLSLRHLLRINGMSASKTLRPGDTLRIRPASG